MHPWISLRALGVLLFLAYPTLTHVAVFTGLATFAWAAWLCLAGLVVIAFPGKWGFAGFAVLAATLLIVDAETLLKLPPVAINLALAAWFGKSLARGEEPVISWFARLVRGTELAPDLARYTRNSTIVWTVFFTGTAVTAAALALLASPQTWSVFANGIGYLLVPLLFVCEYVYRRVRFRHHTHAPLSEVVRAVIRSRRLSPRRTVRK